MAAKERLEAWKAATNYAKRWMIKVQQGKDLGLFDDEDLVEPTKQYATRKAKEMGPLRVQSSHRATPAHHRVGSDVALSCYLVDR